MTHDRARALLRALYEAAVAGAMPGPAVAAALRDVPLPAPPGAVHLLAVGKAAHDMARAAVAALGARGVAPAGGVVIAHHDAPSPAPGLHVLVGDHPIPGERSARAADALGEAAARVGPFDLAVVLLSGGTSALVGAPALIVGPMPTGQGEPADPRTFAVYTHTPAELAALSAALLGAGLPIDEINAVRKRFARWGAGRLARALAPARVLGLCVSDVPGDDPRTIGSGPLSPDPWTARALAERLAERGVVDALPHPAQRFVAGALSGSVSFALTGVVAETPKPGDPCFAGVRLEVVCGNGHARRAAADAAWARGLAALVHDAPLAGDAAACGARVAAALLDAAPGTVHVWGGEPSVSLVDAAPDAAGGRMQALALAAARALDAAAHAGDPRAHGVALLAAGTDGRDGPTDAAGAIVDATTWARIVRAGRDPGDDLARHRSHAALAAAGALLVTGPTGTNVADVVLGVRLPTSGPV